MKIFRQLLMGAMLVCPGLAEAHRLNEYLQATLVKIEPGRIELEMNLTPGVAVAEQTLALVDANGDGVISSNEAAAYGERMLSEMTVQLDGRDVPVALEAVDAPSIAELRNGWGIMQMKFNVDTGRFPEGAHRLSIKNRHEPKISVYIVNAARPKSKAIAITGQSRNQNQSEARIDFKYGN